MIDAQLLKDCRRLAFDVAPELRARPLYILDSVEIDGIFGSADVLGWADIGETLAAFSVRDAIGDAWQGEGAIVGLYADAILESYGPAHFRAGVLETMLHELAHLVPAPAADASDTSWMEMFDTPEIREHQTKTMREANFSPERPRQDLDDHDDRFIRRVLHCHYRAAAAGWDIECYRLFSVTCRAITQPPHYLAALLPELIEMATWTFAKIETTTPPAAFTHIWENELQVVNQKQNIEESK